MAYGLDVVDLIYTNKSKVDIGTLDDYEVDLDLGVQKDFELTVYDYVTEPGAMWYVEGTEFGGIIDGYTTDPQSYKIRYFGRAWRGVLASKVLYPSNSENFVTVSGKLDVVVNQIFESYDLDSLFFCESTELDEDETVTDILENVDLNPGATIYDALIYFGDILGFSFSFEFDVHDRKVHIYPMIPYDYSDYLSYCRDNSVSIKVTSNQGVVNHLICSGVDEYGKRRTIHLFTDEGGTIQPYLKEGVESATKDDDYILDESKKVLTGIDEIADFYDTYISVEDNYRLVTSESKPDDWDSSYSTKYFKKVKNRQYGEERIFTVSKDCEVKSDSYLYFDQFVVRQGEKEVKPTRKVAENGKSVEKSNYWLLNPVSVAIIDFDEELANLKVLINDTPYTIPYSCQLIIDYSGEIEDLKILYSGEELDPEYDYSVELTSRSKTVKFRTEYKNQKVSIYEASDIYINYEPLNNEVEDTYTILTSKPSGWNATYSYYYTRSWNPDQLIWEYSAATSSSTTDWSKITRITSKTAPKDWKSNYGEYYKKLQTGTGYTMSAYSSESKDKFVKMTAQPYDWAKNYSNYYRIRYVKTIKKGKSKSEKEYATQVKGSKKAYRPVPASKVKVKEKGKWIEKKVAPKFKENKYYRKDSTTVIPKYNKSNCYLPATKVVAPTWEAGKYFTKSSSIVKPTYKKGVYYELLEDHYLGMVMNGIKELYSLRSTESQNINAEEMDLNIGDTVGGEDEITGYDVSQKVTNKIVKIVRGVTTVEYEIGGEQ